MISNVRVFSEMNNALSRSGMCVDSNVAGGLLNGCPVPCNPKWSPAAQTAVCGDPAVAICCQTAELEHNDCVFDVGQNCYRPVTGLDTAPVDSCPVAELSAALNAAGLDQTLARCNSGWSKSDHTTHQDPGVASPTSSCSVFAGGNTDVFNECVQALTVADQRGFCLQKSPEVQACPTDALEYVDACEDLNNRLLLACM